MATPAPPTPGTLHILGMGALGTLFSGKLLAASLPQPEESWQLFDLDLRPRRKNGTPVRRLLVSDFRTISFTLPKTSLPLSPKRPGSPLDLLLVFTKSHHTVNAITQIRPMLGTESRIILFQNGLGSQMSLCEAFPMLKIYGGITTEGAYRRHFSQSTSLPCAGGAVSDATRRTPSPSTELVIHAGQGLTLIGPLTQPAKNECDQASPENPVDLLIKNLNLSGIDSKKTLQLEQKLWQKLTINCAINAYTLIGQCRNGAITELPLFQETFLPLCRELSQLLDCAGYPEHHGSIAERVQHVISATANNRSSMLQDYLAERPTEIDDINGFAVKFAREHGFDLPVNDLLHHKVKALTAQFSS